MSSTVSHAIQIEGRFHVVDGDTLKINNFNIRLHGIDAPELAQICKGTNGRQWKCGVIAAEKLKSLTTGRDVVCKGNEYDAFKRLIATCTVQDINLNEQMVLQGYAWAFTKFSHDYVKQETIARKKKLGIWQADNQTAWDFRANKWQAQSVSREDGCIIKGNINRRGERIYHTPWSKSYSRTRINTSKGERWFCNEVEALSAGWRAPLN